MSASLRLRPVRIDRVDRRHRADHGLDGVAAAVAAIEDPLQDAQVVAEPRPQEAAGRAGAEPVHAEDRAAVS
jgi:hypothetical protein